MQERDCTDCPFCDKSFGFMDWIYTCKKSNSSISSVSVCPRGTSAEQFCFDRLLNLKGWTNQRYRLMACEVCKDFVIGGFAELTPFISSAENAILGLTLPSYIDDRRDELIDLRDNILSNKLQHSVTNKSFIDIAYTTVSELLVPYDTEARVTMINSIKSVLKYSTDWVNENNGTSVKTALTQKDLDSYIDILIRIYEEKWG